MTVSGKNLRSALKRAEITQADAAVKLGISRQTLSNWLNKAELDDLHLQNVNAKLGIDLQKEQAAAANATPAALEYNAKFIGNMAVTDELDETPFIDIGEGNYVMLVPLVNEYAYAGYLSGYRDPEFLTELPKHTIIVSKHHKGTYQAFTVVGDSMRNADTPEESIYDGNIVTGRHIQPDLWRSKFHTHRFKDFVVVHKEGILIKRIKEHHVKQGIILLESLNPDKELYPDKEVSLDDVLQIFNIVNVSQSR